MSIPTITTSRLVLRALSAKDLDPLYQVFGGKDVMRYFPSTDVPTRDQVQKMISHQLKHWDEHGFGWWALEPREKNELIGWSGLQFLPETDEIEVAYLLAPAYWGQGLATEAAKASLRYGFEELGLENVVAIVHPENAASRRVIEKLGMSFVDQTPYFGMDCCRYAIGPASFEKVQAIDRVARKGREHFESGYYCAEGVLLAMAEAKGVQSDWIPMMATGFCSGVAQTCGTCGALSGAIMGLGLWAGRSVRGDDETVEANYALVRRLIAAFEERFGSTNCRELIECDLSTEEGQAFFWGNDMFERCARFTEEATRMGMSLVGDGDGSFA